MKTSKIILIHLVVWFFFSGILGMALGPSINTRNIDFEKISVEMPNMVIIPSFIYLCLGWILPVKYFKRKSNE